MMSECFIWHYLSRSKGWTTIQLRIFLDPNHGLCWGNSMMWAQELVDGLICEQLHDNTEARQHDDNHVLMIWQNWL